MSATAAGSPRSDTYWQAKMRARLLPPGERNTEAAHWRQMHHAARLLAVTMATSPEDRPDPDAAARLPWEAFTDGERAAMRAFMRQVARDFAPVAAL